MTEQQTDKTADPSPAASPAAGDAPAGPPSAWRRWRPALFLGLAAVLAAGVAATATVIIRGHGSQSPHRPTGIPASVSDAQVNLMELSPVAATAAPAFTLTDQAGRTLSLASLRGKVVVLEFMDPHCTDICPIVSAEYVDAYRDLGPLASKVVFAAINVNQYYAGVSEMAAYSREHQLETIPSWHFFTGSVPALQNAWRDYKVMVSAPNPNADIVHTSVIYFIDPSGRQRFIASPMVDHTGSGASYLPADQITGWGQGIAQVARTLAG
jgi:cytochrome oxidase Cu insertion factor (SCO1/SenC/PrrC family)